MDDSKKEHPINGDEVDMLSKYKGTHLYLFRSRVKKNIKRRMNKRFRKRKQEELKKINSIDDADYLL